MTDRKVLKGKKSLSSMKALSMSSIPFDFQDKNQERVIHAPGWAKGNSYRFVLEGTGDIFRELSTREDSAYIMEKIRRIEDHFDAMERGRIVFPETGIHPEDSIQYSRDNNPEKFKKMIMLWEVQPVESKVQEEARKLNLSMLKGNFDQAKVHIKNIKNHLSKKRKFQRRKL